MLTISRNLELENGEEFNGKEAPPPQCQRFTVACFTKLIASFNIQVLFYELQIAQIRFY